MVESKPKLIFLWNYVEWGGAQVYLLAVMKQAREEFDITVALPRDSMPDIFRFLDALGIRYDLRDVSLDMNAAPGIVRKLQRQWRRIKTEASTFRYLLKYDLSRSILHIETAPWQSWILLAALALRRSNTFLTMHNIMPRASGLRELIWRLRLRAVSRLPRFHIFASNNDTKNGLKAWVTNRFFEEIKVTYTAVDPAEIEQASAAAFDRDAERRAFGIRPHAFVVLCVGQFIDRKGRWVFLEAASKAVAANDNISFIWLSPNAPNKQESDRIDSFKLGDKFRHILSADVGHDRHSILRYFRIADAFALASYVEGLPIALLEAMAMGLPSVSTNINAIPEAIIPEKTGLLIEPGDAGALCDAILRLDRDPDLRSRLATEGKEYVLKHFDERSVADSIINSYNEALGRI